MIDRRMVHVSCLLLSAACGTPEKATPSDAGEGMTDASDAGTDAVPGWSVAFTKRSDRHFKGQIFDGGAYRAADPTVIRDGALYRMVYSCFTSATTGGLCEVTSPDGIVWTPVAGLDPFVQGVVLRSRPGEWDENVETASLLRTPTGYELYYSGYRNPGPDGNRPPAALGMARSSNGETFTRVATPVLQPIPGSADGDDIFSAVPFVDGAATRMIYTAWCVDGYHDGLPCSAPIATTVAGATRTGATNTWVRTAGPVLEARTTPAFMASGVAEPTMLVDDAEYYLFFTGGLGGEPRVTGVGRSSSPLGPWDVAPQLALDATPGTLDACGAFAPSVVREGAALRMWYLAMDDCSGTCTSCDFETCGCEPIYSIGYAEAPWPLYRSASTVR